MGQHYEDTQKEQLQAEIRIRYYMKGAATATETRIRYYMEGAATGRDQNQRLHGRSSYRQRSESGITW